MADRMKFPFGISDGETVKFRYVNWRGDEHEYVIEPEGFEIGLYDASGVPLDGDLTIVLNGYVVTRDGDPRLDMGTRRRTFIASGITNIELLDGPGKG